MLLPSLRRLASLVVKPPRRGRRPAGRRRTASYRPRLEGLEARTVPSIAVLGGFQGLNGGRPYAQPSVAVGGPYAVELTADSEIAIFDRATGEPLFVQPVEDFFAPVYPGFSEWANGKVIYAHGRFIAIGEIESGSIGIALFAPNPLDGVSQYQGFWAEPDGVNVTPYVGYNADALVIATNQQTIAIDWATFLTGDPAAFTYYAHDNFYGVPAVMHDAAAGAPMWFVDAGGVLRQVATADLLGSSTPAVQSFAVSHTLPWGDDDLQNLPTQVEYRGGRLAFVISSPWAPYIEQPAVWFEYDTSGAEPREVQEGTILPPEGGHVAFAAVAIAPDGSLGFTFSQYVADTDQWGNPGIRLSMGVAGWAPGDPLGTLTPTVLVAPGADVVPEDGLGGYGYGTFGTIQVDPDTGTFWAVNIYGWYDGGVWTTWVSNFSVSP